MSLSPLNGHGNRPLEVGIDTYINKKGKKDTLNYSHVSYDSDGWADPLKWLPQRFDLVSVATHASEYSAWWTGGTWYGGRLPKDSKIKKWKSKGVS